MPKLFNKSLFIFRRDFRLDDNTALLAAAKQSNSIILCFIFDPRQVSDKNKFLSTNAVQFMIESLQDLEGQLKKKMGKLYLFYGQAEKIVEKLLKEESIDALFVNADYTPFSLKRDDAIRHICNKFDVDFFTFHDVLLHDPDSIKTTTQTPYQVFTSYYKQASKMLIAEAQKFPQTHFYTKAIAIAKTSAIYKKIAGKKNPNIQITGGRKNALKILKSLKKFSDYKKERDYPSIDTTNLAAYLKFGCVSIREVYDAILKQLGKNHTLIKQLYWHDFYTYIAYHSPFVFGSAYQKKYNNLKWHNDKKLFKTWCEGKTGFPIVDAGMRQLNRTGFMHNRVRMIVASFLTKDLHIDWQWGERYFAQQLVDYDPAINNGNWQWCASTGCDAQPYFRIFNPWLQQKKFDPDCIYIKTWVKELKDIPKKEIHNLFTLKSTIKGYLRPIVDHKTESMITKKWYKNVSK